MQTTLKALTRFPDKLEAYYLAIPTQYRRWAPQSWEGFLGETFTPLEQVCHVADIETDGYLVRFRRTLLETKPTLESLDGYALARDRSYFSKNDTDVLAAFRRARGETVSLLASLSDEQMSRTASFEGSIVTVRGLAHLLCWLAHLLCWHDHLHLAGLQWLLAKMDAPGEALRSSR